MQNARPGPVIAQGLTREYLNLDMAKPSDFYIGIVEFFGVLLPGASLSYLLQPYVEATIPAIWQPGSSSQGWAIFAVVAYIAGHLLHGLGSWLSDDYVYGKFYLARWQKPHRRVSKYISEDDSKGLKKDKLAAETLFGRVYLETMINPTGSNFYDWCLSDIRLNAPVGASEVDRIQADSKFFRSMMLVFLFGSVVCVIEERFELFFGALALAVFSAWRFCNLRWTATKRVYEYYLLSNTTESKNS